MKQFILFTIYCFFILTFVQISYGESDTILIAPSQSDSDAYSDTNSVETPDQSQINLDIEENLLPFKKKGLIPNGLLQLGQGKFFSSYAFVVDKSEKTLGIWHFDNKSIEQVGYYKIDIGKNKKDKKILGDLATPEGIYFFQEVYNKKQLNFEQYGSLAFTTDYPNLFDQRERKTGSGIWLHAIPNTIPLDRGSRGCIVVRDKVINNLKDFIKLEATPLIIFNSVEYIHQRDIKSTHHKLKTFLDSWLLSWTNKNIEQYMEHYSKEAFFSSNKNWKQWKLYKQYLATKYDFISVELSEPIIFSHNDKYLIRILQNYTSNRFSDFGEKRLYLIKEKNEFKIIAETFQSISSQLATMDFEPPFQGVSNKTLPSEETNRSN